jgi:dihydrofolate reductase
MRTLIVSNAMSLDGYYSGPDDNVMVLELDPAFDADNAERLRAADTLLLGRRSFEGFKSFWPSLADDPDPRWTPAQREVSRRDNTIDKLVISTSLTSEQTEPWQHTTRIVGRTDATSRSPTSNANPAKISWSWAAARSGTTCWLAGWSMSCT